MAVVRCGAVRVGVVWVRVSDRACARCPSWPAVDYFFARSALEDDDVNGLQGAVVMFEPRVSQAYLWSGGDLKMGH